MKRDSRPRHIYFRRRRLPRQTPAMGALWPAVTKTIRLASTGAQMRFDLGGRPPMKGVDRSSDKRVGQHPTPCFGAWPDDPLSP